MEDVNTPSTAQAATTSNSVFNPLLISMIGIVVTTMAIMAYHLLLVKYCIRRHAAAVESAATAPPPSTGVDEKLLQTIPILAFTAVKRDGIDQAECVVCLGELEEEDMVRLLPNCNHAFHVSCIDQWFAVHASCPMCRSPVLRPEDNAAPASPDLHTSDDPNRGGISSENRATDGSSEPPRGQSIGLLRHCASMVTPLPAEMERGSWSRLKRSVSMDQWVVVIDLQRGNCSTATSFSSSGGGMLRRSGSLSTRSVNHFDRVPSTWLRSFSWLRVGKASNAAILPC